MEERIKNLEIEIAYLRKQIDELVNILKSKDVEMHYHYTNVYNNLDYFNEDNKE